jgi:hypothetical protein
VDRLVLLLGGERYRARAMIVETVRLLGTLAHPPVIHLVSPCDVTREFAAAALQALVTAQHVIAEASASAAATVTSVLAALTRQSGERVGTPQEHDPSSTPVRQA